MTKSFFAGSYGGDDAQLEPQSQLECRVCWWVYDPARGDPVHQIPPQTPFTELPADWSCPNCAGQRDGFLVVGH